MVTRKKEVVLGRRWQCSSGGGGSDDPWCMKREGDERTSWHVEPIAMSTKPSEKPLQNDKRIIYSILKVGVCYFVFKF